MKGALFDLDGVVVDSEGVYTEFWADIDRIYPTGVEDFAHVIKGNTMERILEQYFPDPAVQADLWQRLARQEQEMEYRPFEHAVDYIKTLRNKGVKTALVTSSNGRKIENLFAQQPLLAALFDVVITGDDVTCSKPDPEGYLLAAERLGLDPRECSVYEDSPAGLRAGRAAGCRVVGFTTTCPIDVVAPLADETAGDIAELFSKITND